MSEEKNDTTKEKSEPVNIDELEIKILMIVSNEKKHEGIGSFLTRRGWKTTIASNLGQAIKNIVTTRPDFVLISLNHPNKKLQALPVLLTQTFNTTCVLFGEQIDPKTSMALREAKAQHKITGFISGPSVHRAITKILNDIHNPKEEKELNRSLLKNNEPDSISVKGGSSTPGPNGESIVQKNGGADSDMVTIKQGQRNGEHHHVSSTDSEATSTAELMKKLQEQLLGDDSDFGSGENRDNEPAAVSGLDEKGNIKASRGSDNIVQAPTVEQSGLEKESTKGQFDLKEEKAKGRLGTNFDLEEGKEKENRFELEEEREKKKGFDVEQKSEDRASQGPIVQESIAGKDQGHSIFEKDGESGELSAKQEEDKKNEIGNASFSMDEIEEHSKAQENEELQHKLNKGQKGRKGRTLANYDLSEKNQVPKEETSLNESERDRKKPLEGDNNGPNDKSSEIKSSEFSMDGFDPGQAEKKDTDQVKNNKQEPASSDSGSNNKNQGDRAVSQTDSSNQSGKDTEAGAQIERKENSGPEYDLADDESKPAGPIEESQQQQSKTGEVDEAAVKRKSNQNQKKKSLEKVDKVKKLSELNEVEDKELVEELSEFHKALEKSLNIVCKRPKGQIKKLIKINRIDLLVVESDSLNGYLILIHSDSRFDHSGFAEKYRTELLNLMASSSSELVIEDHLSFNFPNINFTDCCEKFADFSMILPNEGSEVGVIYIRNRQPLPVLKESFSRDKVRVSVKDFDPDRPLPVRAFLHLKKNKKYYLYINENRAISYQQKQRLEKAEHPIHIEIGDVYKYKKYYVQIILDHLIEELENSHKKKAA